MEELEIELSKEAYHFNKYGSRMYQEAHIFLNGMEIEQYEVIINYYLDDSISLKNCISFDHFNHNKSFQNRGIGTKVIEELMKFYLEHGFTHFALVVLNQGEEKAKSQYARNIAKKLGFAHTKTIGFLEGKLDLYQKEYEAVKNQVDEKEEYKKMLYFRSLAGKTLKSKIELKPLKIDDLEK